MNYCTVITHEWADARGVTHQRVVANPLMRALRMQSDLVSKLAGEFGLTPAMLARVTRSDWSDEDDDAEAFLRSRPVLVHPKARG
jgi:phage terminase small subunit